MLIALIMIAFVLSILSFASAFFRLIEGHWPLWYAMWVAGWWWPYRPETAATLVAMTLRKQPQDWRVGSYKNLHNDKLSALVDEFCTFALKVKGDSVRLGMTDMFALGHALRHFRTGRADKAAKDAAIHVAKAIIRDAEQSNA